MPEAAVFSAWGSSIVGQASGGRGKRRAVHGTDIWIDNISLVLSGLIQRAEHPPLLGKTNSHKGRQPVHK